MDCTKARTKLGWDPKHSSRETLDEMVAALRATGVL
jgi:nucleoside-diphosphate-sugar epimerase